MLQDYHFYLVGEMVRERCPDAVISHFVHIPWPSPDGWRVLPPAMRDPLLRGLLGCDVVAFHTTRFANNFLACAQDVLGLEVDLRRGTVKVPTRDGGSRTVTARAYPISVDVESVEKLAASEEVSAHCRALESTYLGERGAAGPKQLIVRVDRTDPSKNIVRGFRAFGILLDQHPELRGQVTFLASLLLSENTGAHEELGEHALTVHPFDLQQQADAMYEALTMDPAERKKRLAGAADVVRANDVQRWLDSQLEDLQAVSEP